MHKCEEECNQKPSFALILHSFQEATVFLHHRVLQLSNFMIFIISQHPSLVSDQVAYWDPCNWLVTYWEPCIEKEILSLLKTVNERVEAHNSSDEDVVKKDVAYLVKNFPKFLKFKNNGKFGNKWKFTSSGKEKKDFKKKDRKVP